MMQSSTEEEHHAYYVQKGIPAEISRKKSGVLVGVLSLVCAVIATLFYPLVFGTIGVVLGTLSVNRGKRALGTVGIILSVVFMIIGIILAVAFSDELNAQSHILFGILS